MIPSSGSVIISSPRHPRPKNRGTHDVLNPVAVRGASTAPTDHRQTPSNGTVDGNEAREEGRDGLYGLINHLVAPCRELRVCPMFLVPICTLLLGRIERFRGHRGGNRAPFTRIYTGPGRVRFNPLRFSIYPSKYRESRLSLRTRNKTTLSFFNFQEKYTKRAERWVSMGPKQIDK